MKIESTQIFIKIFLLHESNASQIFIFDALCNET